MKNKLIDKYKRIDFINNALKFGLMNIALILASFGFVLFLIPSKIAAGGVSGVGTIAYYLFKLPVGMTMICLNVPLFLIGIKVFGKKYGFKTLYGTIMLSVYIDVLSYFLTLHGITSNILLASLYGGIMVGLSIGVIMKLGGSTGGTDIVAQLLNKLFKIPTGYALMVVDSVVLVTAGIVFGMEQALYAIITLFATGRMINLIFDGIKYSKMAIIISEKHEEIKKVILYDIDRGGTMFYAKGMYTDKDKKVIMSVIKNNEISELKDRVKVIDADAFIIITDAYQVLGEGFTPAYSKIFKN